MILSKNANVILRAKPESVAPQAPGFNRIPLNCPFALRRRGEEFARRSFASLRMTLLLFSIFYFSCSAFAQQEPSYDRYAPLFSKEDSNPKNPGPASHLLVFPWDLARWPMDKALFYTEKYNVPRKLEWGYEKLVDYGITPNFGDDGWLSGGLNLDWVRLLRKKVQYPDLIVKGWINYAYETYLLTGSQIGVERIKDTPFHTYGTLKYENRPQEHFYGIGPNTSAGDGTAFKMETTTVEGIAGYSRDPSLSFNLKLAYKRVNITNGLNKGRGIIDAIFPRDSIPGLDGDELFEIGPELVRDTRNQQDNSTKGHQIKLGFSYNEGLWHSKARYFKYMTDASKFFRLGSDRRVLVLRFYGEYNSEAPGHTVPFHQMAKLGGHDNIYHISNTLRAYDDNRFFDKAATLLNVEYRYTIWEWGDWKTDAVIFGGEGQVFDRLSRFQFKDFRSSYGIGLRFSILNHVLITTELAHGDEGTRVYVKTNAPF